MARRARTELQVCDAVRLAHGDAVIKVRPGVVLRFDGKEVMIAFGTTQSRTFGEAARVRAKGKAGKMMGLVATTVFPVADVRAVAVVDLPSHVEVSGRATHALVAQLLDAWDAALLRR